jgi:S1-C subfamily serine protease
MRRFESCVFLLAGAVLSAAATAEVDHTMSLSVVQVRSFPDEGRTYFGSGVVVAPERVATNCHVIRNARKVMVSKGPQLYPAVAEQVDTRRDICLLSTPGIPFPVASVGSAQGLAAGQTLYFYGYPRAIGITFSEGKVQGVHAYEGGNVIETTADFTLGGSGGGIFNEAGKLVGLATFLTAGHHGGYYAIPADWISALTSGEARKIEPLAGKAFWEDTGALPAFLKVPAK